MERIVAENGVVFYRSELIPCPHGFSTRVGGISELAHTKGLNLGVDRGDCLDTVLENLRLFSDAVGFERERIISVPQIHSDKVRYVTEKDCGEGFYRPATTLCDGYISDKKGITLGIRTADCVPILIYAPENGGFSGAVAALHAGWRGTAAGIVRVALEKLYEMGADPKSTVAAIGPSIEKCCYCVREDFYKEFFRVAGEELTRKYLSYAEDGVWYADLKGANREILLSAGILEENIDVSDKCTCCLPEEFYSHRFSKGSRGTMLSVITL